MAAKRWIFLENFPFRDKEQGRSIVFRIFSNVSKQTIFSLNGDQYSRVLQVYPDLDEPTEIIYEKNHASTSIIVSRDNCFDNETILFQFERLFKLLRFKTAYRSHNCFCLVDNAKTHTKTEIRLHDSGMKPSTRCPVDYTDFIDDMNHRRTIESYNDDGTSKDLLAVPRELGFAIANKCSLTELTAVLRVHNAFKSVSNQYLDTLYAVNNLF